MTTYCINNHNNQTMKFLHSVIFMIIASFVIQYYVMSYLVSNDSKNITFSRGKVYMASLMAAFMGLIEVIMHDHQYHSFSTRYYLILGLFIVAFFYLYRNQIGIDERNYLNEMIEHHSMALFTSNKILEKTSNYKVRRIAMQIRNIQEMDINDMNVILKELHNK